MKLKIFITILLFPIIGFAQTFELTGVVKDQKGETIPGAAVYVAGTKLAKVTDVNGRFNFSLENGNYDILVQMIGMTATRMPIIVENKSLFLNIILKENIVGINEVVIRPDANRNRYIDLFREQFLGKTVNSLKSKILNPEVLEVDFNDETRTLVVKSDQLIQIENRGLGYKINYLLQHFEYNFRTGIVYYEGYPAFEELPGTKNQQNQWLKARIIAYNGSPLHFFRSLANKSTYKDGFILHKISSSPTPNRNTSIISFESPKLDVLSNEIIKLDTLVKENINGVFEINFSDDLYIVYTKEREPANFVRSGYQQSRPLDYRSRQVSRITVYSLPLRFYRNGNTAEPANSLFAGYFAYEKIGDQLPMEYELP